MELLLPWFTIYSWSFLMACPSLITNFCFCLKASNQMLFNRIGFPTKGAHAIWLHICKEKKVVLLFYLPRLRQWILDTGSFTTSECTFFEKKNKSTQGFLVFGLPVRVGHAIYLPRYKWEDFFSSYNKFTKTWYNGLINNVYVLKMETTLHKFFCCW